MIQWHCNVRNVHALWYWEQGIYENWRNSRALISHSKSRLYSANSMLESFIWWDYEIRASSPGEGRVSLVGKHTHTRIKKLFLCEEGVQRIIVFARKERAPRPMFDKYRCIYCVNWIDLNFTGGGHTPPSQPTLDPRMIIHVHVLFYCYCFIKLLQT